jgi:PAS domain S-box-containing protein
MSVASLLDISKRVHALDDLKKSQEKYQNLVENINDVIFELDSEWKFNYISPSTEAISGFPPETYIGKSFLEPIVPEDWDLMKNSFLEFLNTKVIPPIDYRIKTKNNELIWVRSSAKPIIKNDVVVGVRGVSINITKQKEIEAELIHAKEEAEKADRLKSAFLATMSHELRTPLNAIIGFSHLIDKTIPKKNIIEMAKIIFDSGNHLLNIIESIFELAMLQSHESKLKIQPFFLSDLLKNLKFFLNSELKKENKTHITVSFPETSENKHITMQADLTKLTQLMVNLLSNAVKYTDHGEIKLAWDIQGESITFFVKDTGIGIPKEKHAIVFDRFRQVDDSNTRKYSGVGLGLAICKEISELIGGQLWMESEHGKGSTFYFKLGNVVGE